MAQPFWAPHKDDDGQIIGYEGPTYSDNEWEYVLLGDMKTPGIAAVRAAPGYQIDRQKPNGSDAARIVLRGYLPGPIEVEVMIWTPEQWEKLQDIIGTIWRQPNKAGRLDVPLTGKGASAVRKQAEADAIRAGAKAAEQAAIPVSHPALAPYGITQVVLEKMGVLEDGPEPQTKILRMTFVHSVPATPDVGVRKVNGSKVVKPRNLLKYAKVNETIEKAANAPGKPPSETDQNP